MRILFALSMTDPNAPFNCRHDRKLAGIGVLGDLTTHLLSVAKFLVGDIAAAAA